MKITKEQADLIEDLISDYKHVPEAEGIAISLLSILGIRSIIIYGNKGTRLSIYGDNMKGDAE